MDFNEYQEAAGLTAMYPGRGGKMGESLSRLVGVLPDAVVESVKPLIKMIGLSYCICGIAGESGEVAEKVKKMIRDKGGVITNDDRDAIKKELGDVLWYVSALAYEFDIPLGEVAQANIDKLRGRKERGTLHGNGDNR